MIKECICISLATLIGLTPRGGVETGTNDFFNDQIIEDSLENLRSVRSRR